MTPDYRITVDGQEITPNVQARLIDLKLSDRRGLEADQLSLTLSDADGQLAIPPTGAEIDIALGWKGKALTPCGTYLVDGTEHSGPPDKVVIRASSADFGPTAALKVQRDISWHDETIGSLVDWIAGDLGLVPAVGAGLADVAIPHLDQTNESHAHLLTRLAKDHDAIATIKSGRLLFIRRGRGLTATGRPLPAITLQRSEGDRHTWTNEDREGRYTGVRAYYHDPEQAKRLEALAGAAGYLKTLRTSYPDADQAQAAAAAEWRRLRRARAGITLTLALGRPGIPPETPITLAGWGKSEIDRRWILDRAEHTLGDRGLTSRLTLEPALDG